MLEVFSQRSGDEITSFWRWLGNLEALPDWFQESIQNLLSSYNRAESLIDADLQRHVQRYSSVLREGNRALLVAHSQGNLYANSAYGLLRGDGAPMQSFGIVSVATPASYVAGGGPYFTRTDDLVMNMVRALYPDTLAGNAANTLPDSDWKHHEFIGSYLGGEFTGPAIVGAALSTADGLEWPEPEMGRGPISVTLTWGRQPDVDLHVYEPNGSHVYYAYPQGFSGYLDMDDVTSYGPEHYYVVDCNSLATGTYRVGVNYFHGYAPETAVVQIQAGDVVRDYSTLLTEARAWSGNSSPVDVAHILVTGNLTDGFEFSVSGAP